MECCTLYYTGRQDRVPAVARDFFEALEELLIEGQFQQTDWILERQASTDENDFYKDMAEAMEYRQKGDYTGWRYSIPSSGTLEQDIMAKREQFWNVGEGEIVKFDGQLCFMMASSNQRLAMEYALQGGIPETVIYYYAESVIWLEEALTYRDLPRETAAAYKSNLKGRYKDISDYIENNIDGFMDKGEAQELREKAWAIYRVM